MSRWLEKHTLGVHLWVVVLGLASLLAAIITGEWRLLILVALCCWFTVRT